MSSQSKRIVIIQGHPDPEGQHYCCALAAAYAQGAAEAGHTIHNLDVAKLEFPFLRSRDDQHGAPPNAIEQAQAAIAHADHVVMIYPVWNGGAPAMLKAFLEQTFRPAFIFPSAPAGKPLGFLSYYTQRGGLKGKTARIIATMQMPAFVYRWYFRPHPERNTLRLSGLSPIRESLIGSVESPNGSGRKRALQTLVRFGREAR